MTSQPPSDKLALPTAETTRTERTLLKTTTSKPAVSATPISFLPQKNKEIDQNVVVPEIRQVKGNRPDVQETTESTMIEDKNENRNFEEKLVESDSHSQEKAFRSFILLEK